MMDTDKIYDIILAFSSEKDYMKLLSVILKKMAEMSRADAGTLYIVENDALSFKIMMNKSMDVYRTGNDIGLPPVSLKASNITNICAYSAIKNEIVVIDDVYNSGKFNFEGPKNYDKMTGYRTKSMLTLPLSAHVNGTEKVIGVMQLINSIDPDTGEIVPFENGEAPYVLPALANIAANTLANLSFTREIKLLFYSFVSVMTQAIDERSHYNTNHTKNVAALCQEFTDYLYEKLPPDNKFRLDSYDREQLVMAAYLHDIGKIITPLDIMDKATRLDRQMEHIEYRFQIKRLQRKAEMLAGLIGKDEYEQGESELTDVLELIKYADTAPFLDNETILRLKGLGSLTYTDQDGNSAPILTGQNIDAITVSKGTLTTAERAIMQEHAKLTGRLLDRMSFLDYYKDVPNWAGAHHEFMDGTGYPLGLKEDEIPSPVSILTLMDIYEALTASDRPYKKAMPKERALGILNEMADSGKLNKDLVPLFGEWINRSGESQ